MIYRGRGFTPKLTKEARSASLESSKKISNPPPQKRHNFPLNHPTPILTPPCRGKKCIDHTALLKLLRLLRWRSTQTNTVYSFSTAKKRKTWKRKTNPWNLKRLVGSTYHWMRRRGYLWLCCSLVIPLSERMMKTLLCVCCARNHVMFQTMKVWRCQYFVFVESGNQAWGALEY